MNIVKGLAKWIAENPQRAGVILAALAAGSHEVSKVIKGINRFVTAKQEKYNKGRYVYDHSLNLYLKTTRKLTANDLRKIDRLRAKGLSKYQAMLRLGLIDE